MIDSRRGLAALALATVVALTSLSCGDGQTLILASGTTLQDTGLLDALIPLFEDETGYDVDVIAVGTGQALEMGRRGDADVLFTHDPLAEQTFLDGGDGLNRRLVMYNDFVIVGPPDDPVALGSAGDAVTAMHAVSKSRLTFISRGDDSGTHTLELSLWEELDFDPTGEDWYEETGQGMGATLQVANQRNGYTISDRGTYLALRDTLGLEILFEGDPQLINIYHVMQVNPERHRVNEDAAASFVDFLTSDEAQAVIETFRVEELGEPLFIPAADTTVEDLPGSS